MLCPRVASIEHWLSDVSSKLSSVARQTHGLEDLINAKPNSPDVAAQDESAIGHVDILQLTGQPTASLVLPAAAVPDRPQEAIVSLTADMAIAAPLCVEDATPVRQTLDPATSIAQLNLIPEATENKHGSLEREQCGVQEGQPPLQRRDVQTIDLRGTPRASAPRTSPPTTPRIHGRPDEEPVWGKQYFKCQSKSSNLENERPRDRESLDTLANMMADCATCVSGMTHQIKGMCNATASHIEAVTVRKAQQLQDPFGHLEGAVKQAEASTKSQRTTSPRPGRAAPPPHFGAADNAWHISTACAPDPWHSWKGTRSNTSGVVGMPQRRAICNAMSATSIVPNAWSTRTRRAQQPTTMHGLRQ